MADDLERQVKDTAKKAKKAIVKHGKKAIAACKKGWAKLKKKLKKRSPKDDYNMRTDFYY